MLPHLSLQFFFSVFQFRHVFDDNNLFRLVLKDILLFCEEWLRLVSSLVVLIELFHEPFKFFRHFNMRKDSVSNQQEQCLFTDVSQLKTLWLIDLSFILELLYLSNFHITLQLLKLMVLVRQLLFHITDYLLKSEHCVSAFALLRLSRHPVLNLKILLCCHLNKFVNKLLFFFKHSRWWSILGLEVQIILLQLVNLVFKDKQLVL